MSQYIKKLIKFRDGFNAPDSLSLDSDGIYKRKIGIVKKNLKSLLFLNWVKFVGITGSVAAGTVEDDDDIDVMVVVKNDRVWIYRLLLFIRALFNDNLIQYSDSAKETVKDKIEVNFIIEERALGFDNDIFALHELLCLNPVFNEQYLDTICYYNSKLLVKPGLEVTDQSLLKKEDRYPFLGIVNKFAFYFQYLYSMRNGLDPEAFKAFRRWEKKGRVAIWELYRK